MTVRRLRSLIARGPVLDDVPPRIAPTRVGFQGPAAQSNTGSRARQLVHAAEFLSELYYELARCRVREMFPWAPLRLPPCGRERLESAQASRLKEHWLTEELEG